MPTNTATESHQDRLKRAVISALKLGYQIDQEGFEFLSRLPPDVDLDEVVKEATKVVATSPEERSLWLSKNLLEEAFSILRPKQQAGIVGLEGVAKAPRIPAAEVETKLEVLFDPTELMEAKASFEDFIEYFRDRFRRLEKILRQRIDARDAVSIHQALKMPMAKGVKVIGLVTDKRTRGGITRLEIEDLEASLTVIVPHNAERSLVERAQRIFLDQVICVVGSMVGEGRMVASEILWPEVPDHPQRKAEDEVSVVMTSDLHVGSTKFIGRSLNRFIRWLKGELGTPWERDLARTVKYLIIAGDLVDGIGIYPEQEKELNISDVYEQYRLVASYLQQIPEHVEIVAIPGNHDASRRSLPQPAILKKYAEPLLGLRNLHLLGNPARIRVHGLEFLLYHGNSLPDVVASAPNMSFSEPHEAMELLLRARHLSPIYGERTPITPQKRDYLVIEEPPDVFQAGHVHVYKYKTYRGTLIVNSGTWQGQTEYLKKNGIDPTPAQVPILNLSTMEVVSLDFGSP
ncbi:MAG: DNA-directed DNA polymerase II small subunit [Candidatus Bathyarchaeia archaeon]